MNKLPLRNRVELFDPVFNFPTVPVFTTLLYFTLPSAQNRKFGKVIRYHSRHRQASQRPRIKGQFVKQGTVVPDAGSGGTGVSNGEDYSSQMCDEDDEEVSQYKQPFS